MEPRSENHARIQNDFNVFYLLSCFCFTNGKYITILDSLYYANHMDFIIINKKYYAAEVEGKKKPKTFMFWEGKN